MPAFATPEPISVTIDLAIGDVNIVASGRSDTVVTVTPIDPASSVDVQAAQRMYVHHSPGALEIKQSMPWHHNYPIQHAGITITVELPTDSHVRGKTAWGTLRSEGRLGECEFTSDYGDIRLGEVANALRVKGTNGNILVQLAHADVDAKTTTGDICVAEVIRGTVVLTTSIGEIEVGVRQGSAVNLDVRTRLGRVRNTLYGAGDPAQFSDTVKVRARTNLDDIIIRRS
jgi:Putative adhesin